MSTPKQANNVHPEDDAHPKTGELSATPLLEKETMKRDETRSSNSRLERRQSTEKEGVSIV
jgi:hypothetical protein